MFFVITGSATKTLRIKRIRVSGETLTTLAVNAIVAEKWSTAPTGGTATVLTQVPLDSTSAAGSAGLCQVYTAAPTEGTLVGTLACNRHMTKSATILDGAPFPDIEFKFSDDDEATSVVLRGTAQALSLAFAAAPGSAVTMGLEVEWTEE